MKGALAVLGLCILWACGLAQESAVDPDIELQLAREIAQIKAIDHHAPPVRPIAAGEALDTDYDALPVESLAPQSDPIRMCADPSVIPEAHKLFSGKKPDPVVLLNQLGIESMFANRVAMGPGLPLAAIPLGSLRRCADVPALERLAYTQLRSAGVLRRRREAVEALLRRSSPCRAPGDP